MDGSLRRVSGGLSVAALLLLAAPLSDAIGLHPGSGTALAGQEQCEWLPPSGNLVSQSLGRSTVVRVTDPHLRCADGVRLRADSARHFDATGLYTLFGNALFEDREQRLQGDLIRYWRPDARVEVRGGARMVRKEDGSVVTGENLTLLQATETRPREQLTVSGGRSRVVFRPGADEAAPGEPPASPWDVVADRLFFQGQESLLASGDVRVERDSLDATSEILEYDEGRERLALRGGARMVTESYDLTGDSIVGQVVAGEIRELTAYRDAVLTGEDLRLAAPRVMLFMPEGAVERLVAVSTLAPARTSRRLGEPDDPEPAEELPPGPPDTIPVFDLEHPPRPVARAEDFLLVADSIDVQAPGEVLSRLVAVGRARGESTARDSLNRESTPEIARRDWIDGDTIVASFSRVEGNEVAAVAEPPARAGEAPDTAGAEYRLDELLARVGARTLYRLPPADTVEARAAGGGLLRMALHYVTGDQIRIAFEEGEVRVMEVAGPTEGIHLEPMGGSTIEVDTVPLPPDAPAVDTTATAPDTTAAPPPGVRPGGRR